MKVRPLILYFALLSAACSCWSATYSGYQVDSIRPGGDRACTLFILTGVSQADPVMRNSAWFGIPQSAPGYKEMVAAVFMAKMGSRPLDVETTGATSSECGGLATVSVLRLR